MVIRFFISAVIALTLTLALAQADIQNLGKLENTYDFYR